MISEYRQSVNIDDGNHSEDARKSFSSDARNSVEFDEGNHSKVAMKSVSPDSNESGNHVFW